MFSYMANGKLVIISQSQARLVLAKLLTAMDLNAADFGFHTFRRSGASLGFSLRIPVQYIKAHGTWASDAVFNYLDPAFYPTVLTETIATFLGTTH